MTHSFYFKQVFTCNKRNYSLNPRLSLIETYNQLKPLVLRDFGIEHFDLIIAGQNEQEHASSIIINDQTLYNALGGNLEKAFYIKYRPSPPIITNRSLQDSHDLSSSIIRSAQTSQVECPVCYLTYTLSSIIVPYECIHQLCRSCYLTWSARSNHRCPQCRADVRTDVRLNETRYISSFSI
jgi:hypothetical protein